jgi:hypothetical protein
MDPLGRPEPLTSVAGERAGARRDYIDGVPCRQPEGSRARLARHPPDVDNGPGGSSRSEVLMTSTRIRTLTPGIAAALVLVLAVGPTAAAEPDVVQVQHLLIGFQGSVRGKEITRTKDEARQLATSLFERAQKGEEFDALVREFTDDRHPGIYRLTNLNAPIRGDAFKRTDMVPAFGDVAFGLAVGEVGMAKYNPQASPFGWHVIKRLE